MNPDSCQSSQEWMSSKFTPRLDHAILRNTKKNKNPKNYMSGVANLSASKPQRACEMFKSIISQLEEDRTSAVWLQALLGGKAAWKEHGSMTEVHKAAKIKESEIWSGLVHVQTSTQLKCCCRTLKQNKWFPQTSMNWSDTVKKSEPEFLHNDVTDG